MGSTKFSYYKASADLLLAADAERSTTSLHPTYVKLKEFEILERIVPSEFRVSWQIYSAGGAGKNVNSQIWVNGNYFGIQYATDSAVYVPVSTDVTGFKAGDLIQLYCATIFPGNDCFIKEFRLSGIKTIGKINID